MKNLKSIIIIVLFFSVILLVWTAGFVFFEGMSLLDGVYLTVMTITTVGYGDIVPVHPLGKLFTIFIVFAGVGMVLYAFSKFAETMVEGGLRNILERRKMKKKVAELRNHYIVCGYGRIGKVISQILQENRRPFVVIENHEDEIKNIEAEGYYGLAGEAADDDVLLAAGINSAKGLIAVVSSDADNVFITLTARGLNPGLFILARSSGAPGADTKLLRAGASKVISPYSIGARRMAQLVVRPTVIDFIDLTMHAGELGLRMEEMEVSEKASYVHKNLMESGIRKKYDIIVVAIKREGEEMLFNPKPDTVILPGDILIVLGGHEQISALEREV